jgi:prenyltransferase beta subunit
MLEKSDCLVSAKRSNSVFTFESELFSKIPDVFWNLVYGSSFVSVTRASLQRFLLSMHQPDGSFTMHLGGEVDIR